MSGPNRNLPRFLPTLTEVVQPGPVSAAGLDAPPLPAAAAAPDDVVERVVQRLTPVLENQLREVMASLARTQLQAFEQQLRQELAVALHETVARAVADELAASTRR